MRGRRKRGRERKKKEIKKEERERIERKKDRTFSLKGNVFAFVIQIPSSNR